MWSPTPPRRLRAAAADGQPEPAAPAVAARLADFGVADLDAAVGGRVEQHLLPQPALSLLVLTAREAALLDPADEVVADALELVGLEQPRAAVAAVAGAGRQIELHPRDLPPQLLAHRPIRDRRRCE